MGTLLVRRHNIHDGSRHSGAFREVALGGGRLPRQMLDSMGVFCVDTSDRVYSLTYDDGPDPVWTPRILDVLADHQAHATFFVLAGPARRYPELIRRIVNEGHELALHGLDHQSLLTIRPRLAVQRIKVARAEIEAIAGTGVRLYRPPYGEHTLLQALAVRRLGLDLIIWSGDAHDWVHDSEVGIAARAIDAVFPGAIILLHDARADPETLAKDEDLPRFDRAEVLEHILTAMRARGYSERTVSELMQYPTVRSVDRTLMSSD